MHESIISSNNTDVELIEHYKKFETNSLQQKRVLRKRKYLFIYAPSSKHARVNYRSNTTP
jgi:hypothetical protein